MWQQCFAHHQLGWNHWHFLAQNTQNYRRPWCDSGADDVGHLALEIGHFYSMAHHAVMGCLVSMDRLGKSRVYQSSLFYGAMSDDLVMNIYWYSLYDASPGDHCHQQRSWMIAVRRLIPLTWLYRRHRDRDSYPWCLWYFQLHTHQISDLGDKSKNVFRVRDGPEDF